MSELDITSDDFPMLLAASQGTLFAKMSLTIRHDNHNRFGLNNLREIYERRRTEIMQRMASLISYNIAPYVRSWTVRGNDRSEADPSGFLGSFQERGALPPFFKSLATFTTLQMLTLIDIKIDQGALKCLEKLEGLRTLHLIQVSFGCLAVLPYPLHLTELCIESDDAPGRDMNAYDYPPRFAIQSQDHIETLKLNCIWTRDLSRSIIGTMEETGRLCTNLRTLELVVDQDTVFELLHFLNRCPALEVLTIKEELEHYVEPSLFRDSRILHVESIPSLIYFDGPVELAAKITKGRPIQSLILAADPQKGCYPSEDKIFEVLESVSRDRLMYTLEFGSISVGQVYYILNSSSTGMPNVIASRFQNLRVLRLVIDDIPMGDTWAAQTLIDDILEECRREDIDEYEEDNGPVYDETPDSTGYPLRDPSGNLSTRTHYQGKGYLLLLASFAAGNFKIPHTLQELKLVQSRLFQRFLYTEAHEVAMIEEFRMNEARKGFQNLQLLTIGIDTTLNLGWQRDINGSWVRRV